MNKKLFCYSVVALCCGLIAIVAIPIHAQTRLVQLDIVGSHSSDDINGLDYKLLFNSSYQFSVSAQNTDTANGASLGFLFYSPDGSMTDATLSIPEVQPAWSDPGVWTLGGALTTITLIGDGVLPDQYLTGGAAFPGQGFHQLSPQPIFTFDVTFGNDVGVFCIDSAFYPPAGAWVFSAPGAGEQAPTWVAGSGDGAIGGTRTNALCLTVFAPPDDPPVFENCIIAMSTSYCSDVAYSLVAVDPEGVSPISFSGSHNGAGALTVNSGTGDVVYTPDATDAGGIVTVTVTAAEDDGPSANCVTDITVTQTVPTITCAADFNATQNNSSVSRAPIASDPDNCESRTFSLLSVTPAPLGTVTVSASTGKVTFNADANEPLGQVYDICIQFVSGSDAVSCCLTATITEGCCVVAGDANHDGTVAITDVVYLISFMFQLGPHPQCNDEADANSDGEVNIQDLIILLNYIFRDTWAPVCGTTGT